MGTGQCDEVVLYLVEHLDRCDTRLGETLHPCCDGVQQVLLPELQEGELIPAVEEIDVLLTTGDGIDEPLNQRTCRGAFEDGVDGTVGDETDRPGEVEVAEVLAVTGE